MNGLERSANLSRAAWALLLCTVLFSCSKSRTPPEPAAASSQAAAAKAPEPIASQGGVTSPGTPSSAGDPCTLVCERSRELACSGQAGCAKACSEMLSLPVCKDQLLASLRCFVTHPAPAWECGEEGIASIKEGFCNPEQERFVACIESMSPP